MTTRAKPHQKRSAINQVATLTAERKELFRLAKNRVIPVRIALEKMAHLDQERRALLS